MKKLLLPLLLLFAFVSQAQTWKSWPKKANAPSDSCLVFDDATKKFYRVLCSAMSSGGGSIDTTKTPYYYRGFPNGFAYFNGVQWKAATSGNLATLLGYTPASNAITITGGFGIVGGGDISTSRTVSVDTIKVPFAYRGLAANGFLKMVGHRLKFDSSTYITGNQTITLGGDASGSGTTSISVTVNQMNGVTKNYYDPTSSIQAQLNAKQNTVVTDSSIRKKGDGSFAVNVPKRATSTSPIVISDADFNGIIYWQGTGTASIVFTGSGLRSGFYCAIWNDSTGKVITSIGSPITHKHSYNDTLLTKKTSYTLHLRDATSLDITPGGGTLATGGSGGGTTTNPVTFNNGGAGASSGTTFDGSTPRTVSYNTIGAVPTTRNINTTAPLAGGGSLASDLTISIPDASSSQKGATKLYSTVAGSNTDGAADQNSVNVALAGKWGLTATSVKSSAYTASAYDFIPVDVSAGNVTITLPSAPTNKSIIGVKVIYQGVASYYATILASGTDVFNRAGGNTSTTLPINGQGILLMYNSSTGIWYGVANDAPISQSDQRYLDKAQIQIGMNVDFNGDSYTGGQQATPGKGFTDAFIAINAVNGTVLSVSGGGTYGAAVGGYGRDLASTRAQVLMIGFNDVRKLTDKAARNEKIKSGHRAIIAAHFTSTAVAANNGSVSTTGTWTTVTAGTYGDRASIKLGGLARTSSVSGSTLTYTSSGTTLVIGTWGCSGTTDGGFSVTVDGTQRATYDPSNKNQTISGYDIGVSKIQDAVVLYNLGVGSHTIVITTTSNLPTYIDYIGSLLPTNNCVPIMVGKPSFMNATGYATYVAGGGPVIGDFDMISAGDALQSVVQEFKNEGYPAIIWNWMDRFVVSTGIGVDSIHPNDRGYGQGADALQIKVSAYRSNRAMGYQIDNVYGNSTIRINQGDNGSNNIQVYSPLSTASTSGLTGPSAANIVTSGFSTLNIGGPGSINIHPGSLTSVSTPTLSITSGIISVTGSGSTQIFAKGTAAGSTSSIRATNDGSTNAQLVVAGSSFTSYLGVANTAVLVTNSSLLGIGCQGAGAIKFFVNGVGTANVVGTFTTNGSFLVGSATENANAYFVQAAQSTGYKSAFRVDGGSNTNYSLGVEFIDFNINLNQTKQWATGTLPLQRGFVITAPTMSFVGASTATEVNAAYIGTYVASTNATIQMNNSLKLGGVAVGSGTTSSSALYAVANTGGTNNYSALFTGGRVGIGTVSPLSMLHIVGGLRLDTAAFKTGSNQILGVNGAGYVIPRTLTVSEIPSLITLYPALTGATMSGSLAFSGTAGITGTTTNNNAAAGNVGEFVSSVLSNGSAVSVTNSTSRDIISVSLTAGDWDCFGNGNYSLSTATVSQGYVWINTTSATYPTGGMEIPTGSYASMTDADSRTIPTTRISLASSGTVYLSTNMAFSLGTITAYGYVGCRRIR